MNTRARVKAIPVIAAASIGLGGISTLGKAFAQSTPVAGAEMPTGLEEISLTIEESGVTGMPETLEAGRYLVKVTGPEPGEMGPAGAIFVQLPEGITSEQVYEEVMANPNEMPSWYLEAHFGGGAVINHGTESWAVIDFTPGNWTTTTLYGTTLGVDFEVTGEMPADVADVEASVTINVLEMAIEVAEGQLVAGDNVVTVHNIGAQLHFVDFSKLPDGTTKEDVQGLLDSFMTGTPPAEDGLQEDEFMPVAYIADISPEVTETVPLHLEAGTYMVACWVPDFESGAPHAFMGMWDVVVVE